MHRTYRAFEALSQIPMSGVDSDVPTGGGSRRRPPRAAEAVTTCCCCLSLSVCIWLRAGRRRRTQRLLYHPRGCHLWRWGSDRPSRSPTATRRERPPRSREAHRRFPSLINKGMAANAQVVARRWWIGTTDPPSSTRSRSNGTRSGSSRRSRPTCTSARRNLPPRRPATSTAP